jgi:hypothetical protein
MRKAEWQTTYKGEFRVLSSAEYRINHLLMSKRDCSRCNE